jgi:uncharacterized membrane protein YgdD (TMEM256/DUF423 family)
MFGETAMTRLFFTLGSLLGLIGVAAGAFGAHALRNKLTPDLLDTWEIAVRYQLVHALALLAAAWAATQWSGAWVQAAGWLFIAGTFAFSGSLYLLSLSGVRWLGAITPIGGLALLAGWACLAWAAYRGGAP